MKKFNSILLITTIITTSILSGCTEKENLVPQVDETVEETLGVAINYDETLKSSIETIIETTTTTQETIEELTKESTEEITENTSEENIIEYPVIYEESVENYEYTEPVTETPTIQITNRIIDNLY